jgi:hypothetical protein
VRPAAARCNSGCSRTDSSRHTGGLRCSALHLQVELQRLMCAHARLVCLMRQEACACALVLLAEITQRH